MHTHFIEIYKSKGRQLQGNLSEIKDLKRNLGITAGSADLQTIAVWKIKLKPGVLIAQHDQELNTTIIEKG